MYIGLIIAVVVLSCLLITSVWFAGYTILNMSARQIEFEDELEERIDQALRVLDAAYMNISVVANKPVFFDSPEVRSVINAIQRSRDSVVQVSEIFKDVIIEDNTESVKLPEVKYVSTDDPHNPKDAEELDRDVKNEMIRQAVREGRMEVLQPTTRATAASIQVQGPDESAMMSARAANAYARQMSRINRNKQVS